MSRPTQLPISQAGFGHLHASFLALVPVNRRTPESRQTLHGGQAWMPHDPAAIGIAPAKAGMPAGALYLSLATSVFHLPPPLPSQQSPDPCGLPCTCPPGMA